jgi:hypothetical protein
MATLDDLRSQLQDARKRADDLRARITSTALHDYLSLAESQFQFVDDCISPERMAEPRSSSALAWWLDQTARLLSVGVAYLAHVEDIERKFGPNVKTF